MRKTLLSIIALIISAINANSQSSSFNLFGTAQSIFFYENRSLDFSVNKSILDSTLKDHKGESSSFALQQMDLLLQNNFDENFSFFADIEFKLNYSSEKNWGDLNIQEAWACYSLNDYFNVKFGMLFPEFNNLNSIKNRLNLTPYIIRPIVYEQILSQQFNFEDFIPEKAFVQVFGYIPIHKYGIDYAVYMGNSEASFAKNTLASDSNLNYLSGADTKNFKFKLYGARIGIKKSDDKFKIGLSATHDYDNKNDSTPVFTMKRPILGNLPRVRLGFDFSFTYGGFRLEHESIKVNYYDLPDPKKVFHTANADEHDLNTGQLFSYTSFLYNFDDEAFIYSVLSMIEDKFTEIDGNALYFGGGYKLNSNIIAKAQFMYYKQHSESPYFTDEKPNSEPIHIYTDLIIRHISIGLSVNF